MSFERKAAQFFSVIFHPFIMPVLGMVILFNSGSYISLLPSDVKRIILLITLLGTFIFPVSLIPVLYFRNFISDLHIFKREERFFPLLLILILYIFTFIVLFRLPLNPILHSYALSIPVSVLMLILANIKIKISAHMLGLGGITGLIIALILLFRIPLQGFFVLSLIATGLTATARMILQDHNQLEIYSGFVIGFISVSATILIY